MGQIAEPIEPVDQLQTIRTRLNFVEPISTADDLDRAIKMLALDICRTLETKGLGARRLDLLFTRIDGRPMTISIGTARASRDAGHLAQLLADRLVEVDPGLGVERMTLLASRAEPLNARQLASQIGDGAESSDISVLVDKLSNRLGEDRVYRLASHESDVPERSIKRVSALAPVTSLSWPKSLPRPSRIFSPPEPIETMALLPDYPPASFTWRRVVKRVRKADGPERIFGEWWREAGEMKSIRDYFRVEDEAGGRYWLFRSGDGSDPATGALRWYMHGVFG
jgi:protein ImuB